MHDWTHDVRFAIRSFANSPGFALVIVMTLGIGIGANTAVFSIADQLLLRLLPVSEPERLVVLDAPGPFSGTTRRHDSTLVPLSHPMFEGLRDGNEVFSGILAEYRTTIHFTAEDETETVQGALVSGAFFDVLGLTPSLGRLFNASDDRVHGGHPVIVAGHSFWQRRFGGEPDVLGKTVLVNGQPMTVVGVSPREFHGIEVGEAVDVYVPLAMQASIIPTWGDVLDDWRTRWLTVMGRLDAGVSREQAESGLNVLYRQLLVEDLANDEAGPDSFRERFLGKRLSLLYGGRGTSVLRTESRTPLLVLMGMVGLVLLIACANIANLLLARASSRRREIALRLAIGASRPRLVRQLLVESLVLAILGGLVGLLFATWTAEALVRAFPAGDAVRVFSTELDLRDGLFALVLAVMTGLIFGSAPASKATRAELATTLRAEAGAVICSAGPSQFRRGLVIAQVAVSLLLLIGSGLFARSLWNLRSLDPGFRPERLITFSVDPALNGYDRARRVSLVRDIREEIETEPGVSSVSMSWIPLLADRTWRTTVRVDGYDAKEGEDMNPNVDWVGPGYFATLQIPFLAGRDFTDADHHGNSPVAIVNETFARYFFGDGEAVGRRFGRSEPEIQVEVIGVVGDGRSSTLHEETPRFIYLSYWQNPEPGETTFYLRSAVEDEALFAEIRQAVRRVDATLPVTKLATMSDRIRESLFVERLLAKLSLAFSVLATLLAAIGLYGVMSYGVLLRTREIGIRVALGAERREVLSMVLKDVAAMVSVGVAVGLPAGYVLGRIVESQLFGLTAFDPLAFGLAVVILVAVASFAGYLPAARASRVDPMTALR